MKPESSEVLVPADRVRLPGTLTRPEPGGPIVLFAHGSGSSRLSPRNREVARVLTEAGIGTFLFDLLSETEALDRHKVFDIHLLASRLEQAHSWVVQEVEPTPAIGYFGASTGAAAALLGAADHADAVGAVVSRGGRPDLAGEALERVRAPTLLIVGGADYEVLALNRQALQRLGGVKKLAVVAGATHLFEEPGTLEEVARMAADWFVRHLQGAPVR